VNKKEGTDKNVSKLHFHQQVFQLSHNMRKMIGIITARMRRNAAVFGSHGEGGSGGEGIGRG